MSSKVSVIIVNYNGEKILEECLDSILNQTYKNFEVILVDNDSNDKSVEIVKNKYPEVILIEEKYNHGFAGGNNIGYEKSTGEIIILLNNDTRVDKDYIEKFIKVFEDFPNCGIAQSKIVLDSEPDLLDCAGSYWSGYTMLYHYGYLKKADNAEFNKPYKVFIVKGASMITKRSVIEKIGLFHSDFWHYFEEGDFCHRSINAGYDNYYYPATTCYHKCGHSRIMLNKEDLILFSNTKNRIQSYLLNFRFPDVLFVMFKHFLILQGVIGITLFYQIKNYFKTHEKINFNIIFLVLKAIFWNLKNIKSIIKKRNKNPYKGSEKDLPQKNITLFQLVYPSKY
jgi:GT2 family glycosyltransferase